MAAAIQGMAVGPPTAVTGITTSYNPAKGIKIEGNLTTDDRSKGFPTSCILGDLELVADETGATVGTISGFLTYDAAGDNLAAGEFTAAIPVAGATTGTKRMISIELREVRTWPEGETVGELYLWLKTDAGTMTVPTGGARLGWAMRR